MGSGGWGRGSEVLPKIDGNEVLLPNPLPPVGCNVSGDHMGSLDFYTPPLLTQHQRKPDKTEDLNKMQGLIT